jgi:hypothetical protein
MALFQSRFVPEGYLLDEPERRSPLCASWFPLMVKEMAATQNAQFIIARIRPSSLPFRGYPGSLICGPQRVAYGWSTSAHAISWRTPIFIRHLYKHCFLSRQF